MTQRRVYIGIETLNLTAGQKQTLVNGIKLLGANTHRQPSHRNHWRNRLDNDAVIFEAEFNDDNINIPAIKQRLATIFSVNSGDISHTTSQPSYGLVATLTYSGVDRIRLILFGYDGDWPTYEDSRQATLNFISVFNAEWELQEV